MNEQQRIVITGIGVVSPNALGAANFELACRRGVSGLSQIDGFDTGAIKSRIAGVVRDFDPAGVMDPVDVRRVPRLIPLAVAASKEAIAQARLTIGSDSIALSRRTGVALGTGGGGLEFVEEQYRRIHQGGKRSPFAITAGTHGNLSSEISIQLKLRGPSHVISTGCASSTDAIGHAMMTLRAGAADVMIAGGADACIAPGILGAFEMLGVISTREFADPTKASRPFNRDRDGFILGEGAWMFVVETLDHARRRGATPLAEIAGYASTCDAYHRVQIAPDLEECTRAIEESLAAAGASADEVDYVNLHGTGTQLNDRLETAAIRRVMGERADKIPMSATKSLIGHPQGAGGAAGIAATVLAMHSGWVHPTINLTDPDPQCDLDYVPGVARAHAISCALCNCIAFGSKNSALVVRRI
ncbi:MAG: beta-ketoacyl-[acyl-carrier-protein] synthase family protein [Burkholderiales bacterium]|nr:beta-ketoacyl-[acyl-carrier-protein] synthase family protein [Phycisphaerae bacterium]